jgi:hypothetical protein
VANPTDSSVNVTASVRGWRQTGTTGDLQFYDDPDLSAAITVDLTNFTLGPREAVRDSFSINSSKLPGGGVYAAIFFRTSPPPQSANSSFVVESANVGTLLILTNGKAGPLHGAITALHLPFLQTGSGLGGSLNFQNTDQSQPAVAVKPQLSSQVLPWGHASAIASGLVLPGYTRHFDWSRPGSYFGPLPVTVTDSVTHAQSTGWVLAITGIYRLLVPAMLLLAGLAFFTKWKKRNIK